MSTTAARSTRASAFKARAIKFFAILAAALTLLVVNPKVHVPGNFEHWNRTTVTLSLSR